MSKPWENFSEEAKALTIEDLLKPASRAPSLDILIYDVRPITPADLHEAHSAGGLVDATWGTGKTVKNIRARHHRIAQLLAQDLSQTEVCAITGMSINRVQFLLKDHTFQDLVSHYQEEAQATHQDLIEQLGLLAADATSELHDRLEDAPDNISTDTLLEILKVSADRSGVGPTSKNLSLVGRFQAQDLGDFKERIKQQENLRLVKPQPNDSSNLRRLEGPSDASPAESEPKARPSPEAGVGNLQHSGPNHRPGPVLQEEGEGPQELHPKGPPV